MGLLASGPTSAHTVEAGVGHNGDSWCCVHRLKVSWLSYFFSARVFGIVVSSNDPHLKCRVLYKKVGIVCHILNIVWKGTLEVLA